MNMVVLTACTGRSFAFRCDEVRDGVPINPLLPDDFDETANENRPERHIAWWDVPFIRTERDVHPKFLEAWPAGVRFDVRCLDGGAWDRSTWWGAATTLEWAIVIAKRGPAWRQPDPKGMPA